MAEAVLPTLDQPVVSFEKRRPVFPFANMRITLNSAVLLDWHDVNLQTVQERVFMRGCSSKDSFLKGKKGKYDRPFLTPVYLFAYLNCHKRLIFRLISKFSAGWL